MGSDFTLPSIENLRNLPRVTGSGLVYVCNFDTVSSQTANANDVHPEDNKINNACGSNTAGRDRFSSKSTRPASTNYHTHPIVGGIEHGRTAAGKPFCDGS